MKNCNNCGHLIRKIKGVYLHRLGHYKYSGIASGGATFNKKCLNRDWKDGKLPMCGCEKPLPNHPFNHPAILKGEI